MLTLAKLLAEELKAPPAPVVHSKLSPKQKTKQSRTTPKSQRYEDFSDGNETTDAEDMEIEEVEGLQYNNHFEQEGKKNGMSSGNIEERIIGKKILSNFRLCCA